jgi:hypothetical protein
MADKSKDAFRIQVDPRQYLAFKKLLWEKGLQPQQFFVYVVHCANLYDSRLEPFYDEAVKDKMEKLVERGEEKIDVDSLYRLIETGLVKPHDRGE